MQISALERIIVNYSDLLNEGSEKCNAENQPIRSYNIYRARGRICFTKNWGYGDNNYLLYIVYCRLFQKKTGFLTLITLVSRILGFFLALRMQIGKFYLVQ